MKLAAVLFVLLLVAGLCVSASAAVVTVTDQLYQGMNIISLQGVPIDPAVPSVFDNGMRINDVIFRWDGATQSQLRYPADDFGSMLLGDGYVVNTTSNIGYSYEALDDTDDMDIWISLPMAGWHIVGSPFSYDFPWANAKVTDGNSTVSMQTAAKTNNWIQSIAFWWNAQEQSQYALGLPGDGYDDQALYPKHGYQVVTYVDKLALVLEAQPH